MRYIVGLDIGGTKCAAVLAKAGLQIEIIDRVRLDSRAAEGFQPLWCRLAEAVTGLVEQNGLDFRQVSAIGVSCGGPLDSEQGKILSPPNLPGWDDIPITSMLTERFGVPAFLQNDANACALAEWQLGAGKGSENMLFLTMGTGFGCGIIAGGQLINGTNSLAGEAGHVRLCKDGPIGFGKAGSAEGFCGGSGIARLMQSYTEKLINVGEPPRWVQDGVKTEDYSAKLLADYANMGDRHALALWNTIGEKLGEALSVLIDLFNPARIVIGSIFARCETFLRPAMKQAIKKEALAASSAVCAVMPAALGEQIGDYASIMAACSGLGLMPVCTDGLTEAAEGHYKRLFARYPALSPLAGQIKEAFFLLRQCFRSKGKLLVCGNGGSASDAQHIVGELMKGFTLPRPLTGALREKAARAFGCGTENIPLQQALPAIALTAHSALSTAFINDVDPQYVYAQQVLGYAKQGDVLLAISTSGNSANVVRAAELAMRLGVRTIALTGPGGGKLSGLCDVTLACPGECTADVQEHHLPVYHTLCAMLETTFFS